jgi:hypothetical protein
MVDLPMPLRVLSRRRLRSVQLLVHLRRQRQRQRRNLQQRVDRFGNRAYRPAVVVRGNDTESVIKPAREFGHASVEMPVGTDGDLGLLLLKGIGLLHAGPLVSILKDSNAQRAILGNSLKGEEMDTIKVGSVGRALYQATLVPSAPEYRNRRPAAYDDRRRSRPAVAAVSDTYY